MRTGLNSHFNLEFLTSLRLLIYQVAKAIAKRALRPFKQIDSKLEKEWIRVSQKEVNHYVKTKIAGRAMREVKQ